jgi:hypothetical protein
MTYRCHTPHRVRASFPGEERSAPLQVAPNTRATVLERLPGVITLRPEVDQGARLWLGERVFSECWTQIKSEVDPASC